MLPAELGTTLRRTARARIANGDLPGTVPPRSWGGRGAGQRCALCEKPITHDETSIEIEDASDGATRVLQFHAACQFAWQLECTCEARSNEYPNPAIDSMESSRAG